MEKRKIIAIVGPTASGKTGWGVSIAKMLNGLPAGASRQLMQAGEIISADSRQVYRGLDIGTGKDLKDYGDTPYHLIDICDSGEQFTMFDWLERARVIIEEIFARGKTPIIIGGTGLYIQALTEGFTLEKSKAQNPNVEYFREVLEKKSLEELQKIVFKLKILNSKLDLKNPYRLIRAIERAQSGETITKEKPNFEVLQIAVDLPREILYQRIDQRVDEWFEEGFSGEVQNLLDAAVDPKWLEKIGLEYRILTQYLLSHPHAGGDPPARRSFASSDAGGLIVDSRLHGNDKNNNDDDKDFEDMKQRMKFAIHAYARRQLTWFRRFPEIIWCKDLSSAEKEIKKFLK